MSRLKSSLWSWIIGPEATQDRLVARGHATIQASAPPSDEQRRFWEQRDAELKRISKLRYRQIPITVEQRRALIARLERGELVSFDEAGLRTGGTGGGSSPGDGVQRVGGRAAIGMMRTTHSGGYEWWDAGHAWANRWWQDDGWPAALLWGDDRGGRYWLRECSGPPDPALLVDCECACECGWRGRLDETDHEGGVLRCAECVAAGHPPELRVAI
jgi:hypothetical protein